MLTGAGAGEGEAKKLGLDWLVPPWVVSVTGGNTDALIPLNGPDKAGFCSPSVPKEIFGGGVIPFTAVGAENDGNPPWLADG